MARLDLTFSRQAEDHPSHRVFYRIEPTRVLIVRIDHHARDTPPAL